jgi:hypothetical protein
MLNRVRDEMIIVIWTQKSRYKITRRAQKLHVMDKRPNGLPTSTWPTQANDCTRRKGKVWTRVEDKKLWDRNIWRPFIHWPPFKGKVVRSKIVKQHHVDAMPCSVFVLLANVL